MLFDFAEVEFLFRKPNFIKLKEGLFNTIFTHLLILKFHLQHDLVAGCRRPYESFVDLHLATAAGFLFLHLVMAEGIRSHPFCNILQIMYFFEVLCEVAEFPILLSILQKEDKPINGFLRLIQF